MYLAVFDFDGTLIESDCVVHAKNKQSGAWTTISQADWINHVKDENRYFYDFSDFDNVDMKKRVITPVFNILVNLYQSYGKSSVVILTARDNDVAIKQFLSENGMGDIKVLAIGTNDYGSKALYLERFIRKGIKKIDYYEDTQKHLDAAIELRDRYPDVGISVFKIETSKDLIVRL